MAYTSDDLDALTAEINELQAAHFKLRQLLEFQTDMKADAAAAREVDIDTHVGKARGRQIRRLP